MKIPYTPYEVQKHDNFDKAPLDSTLYTIRDSRNCYLASINKVDGLTYPDAEETARLFAAAPDLLDALIDCLKNMNVNSYTKAERAIKKATL